MPRLRVLAGPSIEDLKPITSHVNTETPYTISSDSFEGQIVVNVKGFTNPSGDVLDSEYFHREDRKGTTWSIQVQGRFLRSSSGEDMLSADDILFGNTFDRPLKLPWGSSAALKFMSYIDPTLTHDLASQSKPWALSPLISTMPYFSHTRTSPSPSTSRSPSPAPGPDDDVEDEPKYKQVGAIPDFPPRISLTDDTSHLSKALILSSGGSTSSSASSSSSSLSAVSSIASSGSSSKSKSRFSPAKLNKAIGSRRRGNGKNSIPDLSSAAQRRSYFHDAAHRRKVIFGPEDIITTDFCYGFLEFSPSLSLVLPGGLNFDLMKYWDGQPVRFVCCERKQPGEQSESDVPWGKVFWCVAIELAED